MLSKRLIYGDPIATLIMDAIYGIIRACVDQKITYLENLKIKDSKKSYDFLEFGKLGD